MPAGPHRSLPRQEQPDEGDAADYLRMIPLTLPFPPGRPLRLLCLGAHADDIEIGCGGTVLHLLGRGTPVEVRWVVLSGTAARHREAGSGAEHFLAGAAASELMLRSFRDGFFPHEPALKEFFEELKGGPEPDVIFTHHRGDRHQDHRAVAELTWNSWRRHLILEYEIPKYEGDLGHPNVYVPLTRAEVDRKVDGVMSTFGSQRDRHWFDPETFRGLLRLRGVECAAAEGYAEAFHAPKIVVE
jgi:LmbE family N-acetylglucosaminyl deacetylase